MNTPTSLSANGLPAGRKRKSNHEPKPIVVEGRTVSGKASRSLSPTKHNCSICKDIGFVARDVPRTHPDFGKVHPCVCRADDVAARRLRRLHRMSNMEGLEALSFENFIPEPGHLSPDQSQSLKNAYQSCHYFAEDPQGWLLLTGTYGCGKTHLAASIANSLLAGGKSVIFQTVPDLLDHLRSTFGPTSEISYDEFFEQVQNTPILILDDFGAHSSSQWANEKLFQILNHRYNTELPTVITTNLRLDTLEPRLRSRLSDVQLVTQVLISAPDFRSGSNPMQQDLSTLAFHGEHQFDTFNVERGDLIGDERVGLKKIVRTCVEYAKKPDGWLVLSGTYGCGKTHLAAAIANHQSKTLMGDVMFIVVPDLLDHLRAAFSPNSNTSYDLRFDQIKNTQLLVLDDLGTESATPWAREKLFQLLNYRYTAMLPTVITTSSIDDIEPRLLTRILDVSRCKLCHIKATSYRGSHSQQKSTGRNSKGRDR